MPAETFVQLGRRAFCHYVCWMAPFMVLGTKIANRLKIPVLHIKADKTKCNGYKKCSEKCLLVLWGIFQFLVNQQDSFFGFRFFPFQGVDFTQYERQFIS